MEVMDGDWDGVEDGLAVGVLLCRRDGVDEG